MSVPAAYLGVILIWSTTPLAIQWSGAEGNYHFGLMARMVIGLLVTLVILTLMGRTVPRHKSAILSYLIAGAGLFGAMSSTYWGAQHIPSGLLSVIFGLSPVLTAVMSTLWLKERRLSMVRMFAIVISICGLGIIFLLEQSISDTFLYGAMAILFAVVIHSATSVWIKRIDTELSPLALNSGSLMISVPLFAVSWLILGDGVPTDSDSRILYAIGYLGIMGSSVGFVLYYYILHHLSATVISLITLITPVIALWLGSTFNDEVLGTNALIGTATIMLGLLLFQLDTLWHPKARALQYES
ncbi:MAG: DMT family transporter [Gammaproteobacteria bacterium]|nr:DMT family transporter [Gammaproteobacteria bacterium]